MKRNSRFLGFLVAALFFAWAPAMLWGQAPPPGGEGPPNPLQPGLTDPLGLGGGLGGDSGDLHLDAYFQVEKGGRSGRLYVTASPSPGWHIYSITQRPNPNDPADKGKIGPKRTTLSVEQSAGLKVLAKFTTESKPRVHKEEFFDFPSEEHREAVTWTAPIELAEGVKPESLIIKVAFDGQTCDNKGEVGCVEKKQTVEALFDDYYDPFNTGGFQAKKSHVVWRGSVTPEVAQPGGKLTLVLEATPGKSEKSQYHVYTRADVEPDELGNKPTLIAFQDIRPWKISGPRVVGNLIEKEGSHSYYEEPVRWEYTIEIPADAKEQRLIEGRIGFQTCNRAGTCDLPDGAAFQVLVPVGPSASGKQIPIGFAAVSYKKAAELAKNFAERQGGGGSGDFYATMFTELGFKKNDDGTWSHKSIFPGLALSRGSLIGLAVGLTALMGLLGGMILNVMPCVLPVIGLKIMSFVQQAGESRWRVFSLNLWYSLGVLLVFMAIATAAAVVHVVSTQSMGETGDTLGWGDFLRIPAFSIPLIAVIFTLSLSLLGVWEIPIPGFVGSGKASELSQKEGPMGAVFKGIVTTLLATPCSGPFIGVVVGIAVIAPIWLNYTIFFFMAVGMALPFLVIGAFPRLIAMLPKPGAWMETFKQIMGFVLLGTVVWVFYSLNTIEKSTKTSLVVPTMALLTILALACWIVGRVPVTAEKWDKAKSWIVAGIFVLSASLAFFAKWSYMIPLVAMVDGLLLTGWMLWKMRAMQTMRRRIWTGIGSASVLLLAAGIAYLALQFTPLPWEEFTRAKLDKYRQQGYTVLVDFTADW